MVMGMTEAQIAALPEVVVKPRDEVAILVVDYGTPRDIENLIRSADEYEPDRPWWIWRNYHPTHNGEFDPEFLEAHPNVFVHQHDENLGHGKGINRIATRAIIENPQYLFVLNPDTAFTEPIIDRMVEFLEKDPDRALVGPKQMDSTQRITHGGFFGTNEEPKMANWKVHDPGNRLSRENKQAVMVAGAAFVISVADWLDYGPLLETSHYYNETKLCYHLTAHGRQVWYMGEVSMIHEWHKSTPMGSPLTDGAMAADREMFRQWCDSHNPPIAHD